MRNLALVLCFSLLAIVSASAASAQSWTATASSGAVDESALSFYASNTTEISYLSTSSSTSSIVVRYNVTSEGADTPSWTTFEILADNANLTNGVTAVLYSFARNATTGTTLVRSIGTTAASGYAVSSTSLPTLDFANNYYVVEVTIVRSSSSSQPRFRGVRLY